MRIAPFTLLAAALMISACATSADPPALAPATAPPAAAGGVSVDTEYYRLPNGLKVVLAPEHSVPTVTVAVYYGIGFRIEPRDRTGFAHLFEHLMFQGSANAPKGTFDQIIYNSG